MEYKVYFGKTEFGRETTNDMTLLASFNSLEEAKKFICKRISEYHSPNYYIRIGKAENLRWYDYGSHTEFYAIEVFSKN